MAKKHLPVRCCGATDNGKDDDPSDALLDTICGFYVDVLDRLPVHEYPYLVHCLFTAGHCYGVLEPASNILLHTIAAHGRSNPKERRYYDTTDEFMSRVRRREYWRPAAWRSLEGLTIFLMNSCRYLSRDQALRYLALTEADTHLARDLIVRDFHASRVAEEELPLTFADDAWIPSTEDAVTYAALAAEHPNPGLLAKLATKPFGTDQARNLAAWLNGDRPIDKAAVDDMYRSLISRWAPSADDNLTYYLTCLRVRYPAKHTNLTKCIHHCPSVLKDANDLHVVPPPSPCEYIKTLEALLLDYIHALHLSAVSRLSPDAVKELHHGLVVAGYLYGPFPEPVFNVILNAIWYRLNVPPIDGDDDHRVPSPPVHTICTDLMLRNGFNSVIGQVAFLCSKYGSTMSGHDAMECLCVTNCNIRGAQEVAEEAGHRTVTNQLEAAATVAAVKAMKHPMPDAMMALMDSFTPELEARLRDLLPAKGRELSGEDIDHISWLLSSNVTFTMSPPAAITMRPGALAQIASQRRLFKKKQRFIMKEIKFLLDLEDENSDIHTICALARSELRNKTIYHVNFLATKKDRLSDDGDQDSRVLYFAQIVRGGARSATGFKIRDEYGSCEKNWERSFCCPVTISAFLGRCVPCDHQGAKIVHPIGIDLEYCGRQDKSYINFADSINKPNHTVDSYHMDSDYVYFDPSVNTELATYLNERAQQKEEMTEEEAHQAYLEEMTILGC